MGYGFESYRFGSHGTRSSTGRGLEVDGLAIATPEVERLQHRVLPFGAFPRAIGAFPVAVIARLPLAIGISHMLERFTIISAKVFRSSRSFCPGDRLVQWPTNRWWVA